MSLPAKRFWKNVSVKEGAGGFEILLDERAIKTPAKSPLAIPTAALAEMIASEWRGVEEEVDPNEMPATRLANSVIEKVVPNKAAIVEMLSEYGGTDLLCYRATRPEGLIAEQAKNWDPLLEWVGDKFGKLNVTQGVMHVAQPQTTIDAMEIGLENLSPWQLGAMHELITISGSLVLSLAVGANRLTVEEAWMLSRIDESWQIAEWGEDEEASAAAEKKRQDFLFAWRFYDSV